MMKPLDVAVAAMFSHRRRPPTATELDDARRKLDDIQPHSDLVDAAMQLSRTERRPFGPPDIRLRVAENRKLLPPDPPQATALLIAHDMCDPLVARIAQGMDLARLDDTAIRDFGFRYRDARTAAVAEILAAPNLVVRQLAAVPELEPSEAYSAAAVWGPDGIERRHSRCGQWHMVGACPDDPPGEPPVGKVTGSVADTVAEIERLAGGPGSGGFTASERSDWLGVVDECGPGPVLAAVREWVARHPDGGWPSPSEIHLLARPDRPRGVDEPAMSQAGEVVSIRDSLGATLRGRPAERYGGSR